MGQMFGIHSDTFLEDPRALLAEWVPRNKNRQSLLPTLRSQARAELRPSTDESDSREAAGNKASAHLQTDQAPLNKVRSDSDNDLR